MQEPLSPLDAMPSPQGPPPMPQGPPVMPMLEEMRPTRITLFGVLHIVFACFGLLFAISGIVMVVFQFLDADFLKPLYTGFGQMKGANADVSEQYRQLRDLQRPLLPYQMIQLSLNLVVSILMLMAGVKLIKLRKNGIKWSNVVSMLKIAAIILSALITMKVTRETMQQSIHLSSGSRSPAAMEKKMQSIMTQWMPVFQAGILLSLILYPASALYFLNQPKSKDWLARHGKD